MLSIPDLPSLTGLVADIRLVEVGVEGVTLDILILGRSDASQKTFIER